MQVNFSEKFTNEIAGKYEEEKMWPELEQN